MMKTSPYASFLRGKMLEEIKAIDDNFGNKLYKKSNTADATGKLLFNMLGAINQFETEIRAERQTDGIIKAKEKGVKFGATKKLTGEQIKEMREKRKIGVLIKILMKEYNLSEARVYRYLEVQAEKL